MYLFSRFSYNRTKRLSRNALKNVDNIITRDGVERRGKCPRLPNTFRRVLYPTSGKKMTLDIFIEASNNFSFKKLL